LYITCPLRVPGGSGVGVGVGTGVAVGAGAPHADRELTTKIEIKHMRFMVLNCVFMVVSFLSVFESPDRR
jgi:hypothetical protein